MNVPKDAILLRIFFGEEDRFEGNPLHEAIVRKAREMHVAGATVFRGPMGFGHSSRLHTAKVLRLSFDLPIVVEIVDTEAKINEFLPTLDKMMASGLVTLTDNKTDRRVQASYNKGQLTGTATITFLYAGGVSQTFKINSTSPHPTCSCPAGSPAPH